MTTITIGKAAGNFDFDIGGINFKTFWGSEGYKDAKVVVAKGVQTATLTQKDGDYTAMTGSFSYSGLQAHDRTKAIKVIDSISVGHGKTLTYTIDDFTLKAADIKTDKALAAWADKQAYEIFGNNGNNELSGGGRNDMLQGNGGNDALHGGYGDDKLFGGDGNDLLDGGAGKNLLDGGDGDDTYVLGKTDRVEEAKGKSGGFDTIVVQNTADLTKFDNVEAAELDGKGNYNLRGNDLANTLQGNDGKNVLDGGKGADKMIGGNGDDVYVVDNAKDVVVETGKKDHDRVEATVDVDLTKMKGIEDVFLFGKQDLNASGNDSDNKLVGNGGENVLWGGRGEDELTGGKGSDTFEFHKGDGRDTITDFDASGSDHDLLDLQGFGKKVNFDSLTISKSGKSDVDISFGKGDVLHIHLDHSSIKDIDASDFQF